METFTFNWEEVLNTGHDRVDKQHKKLIDILNSLIIAYNLNNEKALISKILFELEDYANYHFRDEETVLSQLLNYPSEEHLLEHKEFIMTIRDLKFEYVSENKPISRDLIEYLKDWLKNHILGIDKAELSILTRGSEPSY
jgi:hemerythrin-like metal-binding protein